MYLGLSTTVLLHLWEGENANYLDKHSSTSTSQKNVLIVHDYILLKMNHIWKESNACIRHSS